MSTRTARQIPEYEIAQALLLELAVQSPYKFALMGFYDDDIDFLVALRERLGVENSQAFHNKLTKVVRKLVAFGILYSKMKSTHKWYIGEPAKQMTYYLAVGKAPRLQSRQPHYNEPEWEAAFMLRRVYPECLENWNKRYD